MGRTPEPRIGQVADHGGRAGLVDLVNWPRNPLQEAVSVIASTLRGLQMRERAIPAAIIALGLIVSSFLIGGRYTLLHGQGELVNHVIRLDRYTGTMSLCGSLGIGNTASVSCGTFTEEGLDPRMPPQNSN